MEKFRLFAIQRNWRRHGRRQPMKPAAPNSRPQWAYPPADVRTRELNRYHDSIQAVWPAAAMHGRDMGLVQVVVNHAADD
jgi:hypothetical protein